MVQRRGLGRGLGALIPGAEEPTRGPQELPLSDIAANPTQPRKRFDQTALEELAATIRTHGVLAPVVVRRSDEGYQVIAGERRVRAAKLAGLSHIPAIVREAGDGQALEMALVENLQREDLNPVEEAESYRRLVEEHGYTQEQLADRLGRDRSTVANSLRLLKLPEPVQQALIAGAVSPGHARALLALDKPTQQREALRRILAQGLSVRSVEALVKTMQRPPSSAKPHAPPSANVKDLEERLRRALKTQVRLVTTHKDKGRIEIPFSSLDELDRLLEVLLT